MKYFVAVSTVRIAADLDGVHRNTAILFFNKLRCSIAAKQQERAVQFVIPNKNEIELDASYFSRHRKGSSVEELTKKGCCLQHTYTGQTSLCPKLSSPPK